MLYGWADLEKQDFRKKQSVGTRRGREPNRKMAFKNYLYHLRDHIIAHFQNAA
jgi:hypothetical protein